MQKTAAIYDKWLATLGGGEVVACMAAKTLYDAGFAVTLISGKLVNPKKILNKLGIDLTGVQFVEIWNDETELKKTIRGKDVFINLSYLDYSYGFAKHNIYYAHFPTKEYTTLRTFVLNKIVLPAVSSFITPMEVLTDAAELVISKNPGFKLEGKQTFAFYNLTKHKKYTIKFTLFYEKFEKTVLEDIVPELLGVEASQRTTRVDHYHNTITFTYKVVAAGEVIRLDVTRKNKSTISAYLLNPQVLHSSGLNIMLFNKIRARLSTRLRAGMFSSVKSRINSYELIITHSEFVLQFVKSYWNLAAKVIYPPVSLIPRKHTKKNMICSVGRFFMLGHGKKQEVMIEAFKKICDAGTRDWELHLVGGVGTEPTSIEYVQTLKSLARGYPVFFHCNVSRGMVKKIVRESRIYWHAAGYGENAHKQPIRLEHFGIAPVEAISAGAYPILFNGGGLPEIIRVLQLPQKNHLFTHVTELVELTLQVITDPTRLQAFNANFKKTETLVLENFSVAAFQKKLLQAVSSLQR